MAQNDYWCFGYMGDSRLHSSCQTFISLLVVRSSLIKKRPIIGSSTDTEFRLGKVEKF